MKITRRGVLVCVLIGCLGVWLVLLAIERLYRPEENYTLIVEGLYMGGYVSAPPPGTHAVLNLCEAEDGYQCEIHVWDPIRDSAPAPSIDWLREKVAFVETQRQAGKTTFVHCRQGVSRSGMVVAAYLMHKNQWTRDQAIEFIRGKRPEIRPNPAFMELLSEWERTLKFGCASGWHAHAGVTAVALLGLTVWAWHQKKNCFFLDLSGANTVQERKELDTFRTMIQRRCTHKNSTGPCARNPWAERISAHTVLSGSGSLLSNVPPGKIQENTDPNAQNGFLNSIRKSSPQRRMHISWRYGLFYCARGIGGRQVCPTAAGASHRRSRFRLVTILAAITSSQSPCRRIGCI
jgi:hypothetical protein